MLRIALLALSACTTTVPVTGEVEQSIVGGEMAHSADFPTVVALEEAGDWFCTGTLIDQDWILTAAHCVEDMSAVGVQIRLDANNLSFKTAGRRVAVAAIYSNPGYNGATWDNDIALIRLAESVTDREPTPFHRPVTSPSTTMIQVGYGASSDTGGGGVLRKLSTTTIDCTATGDPAISATNVVCFDQSDGNGTCYGDSGGPSFIDVGGRLEVAAITSGGTLESCMDGFDIQTAVAGELDFITQAMSGELPPDGETAVTEPGDGGCSSSGSSGGLLLVGLAALVARRRRSR
jgi:MYXO-CTERM domain-containing protein